ncbi:hypothetical protein HBI38_166430 [Parastagonospora nodorum]|nr:hypothetical protein HBI32_059650 [Parastagonospora nodorum]KAH6312186.1 hypothetical protein HBI38_166430 [Parastagonospora nodorum]
MLDSSEAEKHSSPLQSRRRRSVSAANMRRHQVEDEHPPETAFHVPEVQQALSDVRSVVSKMVGVLSTSNLHLGRNSSVQSLHQKAIELERCQIPSSRIVGLVGDSGVGKSSLINSLLDKNGFAKASSKGAACTCAVTEFIYHDRDDFAIQIEHYSLGDLKRQFEELLGAYREYHSMLNSPESGGTNLESDEAKRQLVQKAKLATQIFQAQFGKEIDENPGFLISMAFDSAVGKMVETASQLLPNPEVREKFTTMEKCSKRLKELSSRVEKLPSNGMTGTYGPYALRICVYLKAYILSKGLILADLPGLRDHDSVRRAITERYIRKCDQIFLVTEIGRAATDASIPEILDLGQRADLTNIDIVLTRSEEMQMSEAREEWPEQEEKIDKLRGVISSAEEEIHPLSEAIKYYKDCTDLTEAESEDLRACQEERGAATERKEEAELELLRLLVGLRNPFVTASVRKQYQDYLNGTKLSIFCVSNTMYWKHRERPANVSLDDLKLSGILELRRHCLGIVASSQLAAFKSLIEDEVPAFLGSMKLWVKAGSSGTSAQRIQIMTDAVSRVEQALKESVSSSYRVAEIIFDLEDMFNQQIALHMRKHRSKWSASAEKASLDWQDWNPSTYKAFCHNYGNHQTDLKPHHCWNEEAITHMKGDMKHVWTSFVTKLQARLEKIPAAVADDFATILDATNFESHSATATTRSSSSAVRTLDGILRHRKNLAIRAVYDATDVFMAKVSTLETDMLTGVRTAFIGECMEDAYHAANLEYGRGSTRKRQDIIGRRFGSATIFDDHRLASKTRFDKITRDLEGQVKSIINEYVMLIEADLEVLRNKNNPGEGAQNPEFRTRVKHQLESAEKEVHRAWRVAEGSLRAAETSPRESHGSTRTV